MSEFICPHPCANKTDNGHCGMDGGHESCQYIKYLAKLEKEKTCIVPLRKPRTNYDCVISKTPEELAVWMNGIIKERNIEVTCDGWLRWLLQEAGK